MNVTSFNEKNKQNIASTIDILFKNNIPEYLRKMLIARLIWAATENSDEGVKMKYIGQPFWSANAIKLVHENLSNGLKWDFDLRHEHAVPKIEIINMIYNLKIKCFDAIYNILNTFAHAVVITKDEDNILNKNGLKSKMSYTICNNNEIENVFSRYIFCKINICKINNLDVRKISLDEIDDLIEKCLIFKGQ